MSHATGRAGPGAAALKVAMIGNTVPPDRMGGHGRYVRELSEALGRKGVEVTIVVKQVDPAHPRREEIAENVVVDRHPVGTKDDRLFGALYPVRAAAGVLGALRRIRPHVVHAHFSVTTLPLALIGRPYLFGFHAPVWRELVPESAGTYKLPPGAVRGLRAAERLIVSRAERCITLSEFMRGEVGVLSPAAARRTHVVPGGIDGTRFSPGSRRADLRNGSEPLLFAARRLTHRTGVDTLLRAMPSVLERHPGARLALAGTGSLEDELHELAGELRLGDRVRFLGHVSDAELVDWYRSADLVVMPTRELEGFGLSTAEALACGTPVVGTDAGATPEILAPLDPALVAGGVEADPLAAAMNRVLGEEELYAAVRAGARDRVMPAMGWDALADAYLMHYEQHLAAIHGR